MNKLHFYSVAISVALMTLATALVGGKANASELFEPQNSQLTQSVLAPGSRFFIAVDDETAVTANVRYVSSPTDEPARFATTERQAIAAWLAWAERERPSPSMTPAVTDALEAGSPFAIHQLNVEIVNAPLRTTNSIGPIYAN